MGKKDKLIKRIFEGKLDITPDEAAKILEKLGFVSTPTSGSHLTFRKPNRQSVTIVITQKPLKTYLIEKLQEALKNEGYKND
ncbi:MAG: type II toxin-antitoxin system HicA family toxin [Treponema sp.]|nr:type II toxin-antitoxin system HicA family toxin [Treponema sp.]